MSQNSDHQDPDYDSDRDGNHDDDELDMNEAPTLQHLNDYVSAVQSVIVGNDDDSVDEMQRIIDEEPSPIVKEQLRRSANSTPSARSLMQFQATLHVEHALTAQSKFMADKVIVKANEFQFKGGDLVLIKTHTICEFLDPARVEFDKPKFTDRETCRRIMSAGWANGDHTPALLDAISDTVSDLFDGNFKYNFIRQIPCDVSIAEAEESYPFTSPSTLARQARIAETRTLYKHRRRVNLAELVGDEREHEDYTEGWPLFARLGRYANSGAEGVEDTLRCFLAYDAMIHETNAYIQACRGAQGRDWAVGPNFRNEVEAFVFSFQQPHRQLPWPFPDHPPRPAGGAAGDGRGGDGRGNGGNNRERGRDENHHHDPIGARMQQQRRGTRVV